MLLQLEKIFSQFIKQTKEKISKKMSDIDNLRQIHYETAIKQKLFSLNIYYHQLSKILNRQI